MHPARMFFLALIFLAGFSSVKSQDSEGWAAGEIVLEYVNGTCEPGDSMGYDIILKFYRDDIGSTAQPFPDPYPWMFVYSPKNGVPITSAIRLQMDLEKQQSVTQYCLNGNPVATEGGWYRSAKPFRIASSDQGTWFFAFQGRYGGAFRSSEDLNIALGQTFYNETRLVLNCGYVTGKVYDNNVQAFVDTTFFNPAPRFTPTDYVFEDPVASFCVGKTYEWNQKALIGDDFDKVEFEFAPIWRFKNLLASYLASEGYSIKSPFPTVGIIDDSDLENRGILRFTAEKPFAGPVPFYVYNYRTVWDTLEGSANIELVKKSDLVVLSQREYRFIFDDDCNSRLPEFIGGEWREANPGLGDFTFFDTYNPAEDAYEFDCATTEFVFNLTEPVLSESLGLIGTPYEEQDQGFRLASWENGNPPDIGPNAFLDDIPIRVARAITTVNVDETDVIRITLDRSVGPGKYTLYMKKGDDLNTLVNRCESVLPEFDSLATIYINTKFEYEHPVEEYAYCFPAGDPPIAQVKANIGDNQPPYYVGWRYYGGSQRFFLPGAPGPNQFPTVTFHDTTLLGPRRFRLDNPEDPNWVNTVGIGAGYWEVGLGYDYSTYDAQTGQVIESRICYAWDYFWVDTVTVDSIYIDDYDLCPKEDLPIIDLTQFSSSIIQDSSVWYKRPDQGGYSQKDIVSTNDYVFDPRGSFTGVNDTNTYRGSILLRGRFNPTRKCRVDFDFQIFKNLVEGEIFPRDSQICANNEYQLVNADSNLYFKPEQYEFQWFFGQDTLFDDTAQTSFVQGSGFHILEVTKNSIDTTCSIRDTVYVQIAPFMDSLIVFCDEITFNNGQVEQLFRWYNVPFATAYEAREVKADLSVGPWVPVNGMDSLSHRTIGGQVALEVRAVNERIAESSICRYGDTSYAKACDALVKPTNVFTPNGDGINDFLKFDLVEVYPGSSLIIFNRWGNKVYEDNDYYNDWDGEDFQEGTYFYVLDVKDPEGLQDIIKGTFTLIRD